MKKCFKCNQVKSLSEFYRHSAMTDGHLNKCKDCTKKDARNNRRNNIDYYRYYDRKRADLPHRVKQRQEYAKTARCHDICNISSKAWRLRNPEKRRAHIKVSNALRDGILIKNNCEKCGSNQLIEAHHDDYSKPLDVKWLCHKCHMHFHKIQHEIQRNQRKAS